MNPQGLRDELRDWTDVDIAGVLPPAKHVFWSNHPVGTMLYEVLGKLVAVGVLEQRYEPDIRYRWNPAFVGSWERAIRSANDG
jgi:hypothetical protein